MAVRFILGRSGTGKTTYCIKAVTDALLERGEKTLLLLVPEQATYQAERAILADERIAGYNRLHVLSFDRLQFLLLGKNAAHPVLSGIGRQMIVHRILRANRSKLKLFGKSAAWPGLARQIAETIAELHQYAKTPDDISRLLDELGKNPRQSLACLKFGDIRLIFAEYLQLIEGDFLDPDAQLVRACRAVPQASLVRGAELWVDGFAGFTTAELAMLAELLKVVEDAHIALCLDPANIDLASPDADTLDPAGLFNPTERTYAGLFEITRKSGLKLARPVVLERAMRFSGSAPLAHVERNLFSVEPSKLASANGIRIVSAPNARAEARFVARQIRELVKDKGYRYRDIAVIASDISRYEHYIKAYFDDYRVPFFLDKRRPLNQHPVVQLASSALHAVTRGFAHSDMFAYFKTDLVPVDRYEVDSLENYCLAFGVSARDWQGEKAWDFAGSDNERFDDKPIDLIRRKVGGPLLVLQGKLCPADDPKKTVGPDEFTRAVFEFFDELGVRRTMARWIREADERKDRATADEHQQFYARFLDVFDELTEVFAGHRLTADDYVAVLNSAFSQLTLAFIPPTLDQVLVGSIERSRHPDLKVVFLVGATQRQFPTPIVPDSILTNDDRVAAESTDFPLAPTSSQTLAERQYLAYIAFTRPSQYLVVTYPSADEKGSEVPRSQFVVDLESLFEHLSEESAVDNEPEIEKVQNRIELADLLCSGLGRDAVSAGAGGHDRLDELLSQMSADEQLADLGSSVLSAIDYDNRAQLDGGVVEALFGKRISSSATRLCAFAACPYQHFARYVLKLAEREEFKFEPLDVGAFYHRVLDTLVKRLNAEGRDFAATPDEELLALLREVIQKLCQGDPFISNFVSRREHNAFIVSSAGEVLEDCVLAIAQMVRAGHFRPKLSEVSFGRARGSRDALGRYELSLPDGRALSLDGKIDRLDSAQVEGPSGSLIFDYKRSEHGARFDWSRFYHGLDLQLPIYILAVRSSGGAQYENVVGAFYMPVQVSPTKATLLQMSDKTGSFKRRANGIFNGDFFRQLDHSDSNTFYNFFVTKKGDQYGYPNRSGALTPEAFEEVLRLAERKIVRLAQDIVSGEISIRPYRLKKESPCGYCCYKPVCRFDWQINDYNLLEPVSKLQVLEKMGAGDG
ncbi:MAG: exodeoxyribonuclease V subunit gamma [Phycisphaerales bacterium]|nr:MAG: exodeoxyribonuclease V subunit gamma [Phycisphaerales bacterium]